MQRAGYWIVIGLWLAACGKEESAPPPLTAPSTAETEPLFPVENMMRGAQLYQEQCAQCHGPEAQGHPDWENPAIVAAPPLNGTGNAWKKKKSELIAIIRNGASRNGMPVMPAWKGRLTEQDMEDIVIWFQALWPPEVYDDWREANAAPVAPQGLSALAGLAR